MTIFGQPAGYFNQFAINEVPGFTGFSDTTGRTLSDATISVKTLLVFIIDQSTGANDRPTPYTVANPTKLRQINPYDGNVYRAADPQLGPNGNVGCWYTKLFDTLITNGKFGSVIMSNCARSGQASRSWRGFRLTQGDFYGQAMAHVRTARKLGLFIPDANLSVAVQIGFGVTDGTSGVTGAEYQANVLDLIAGLEDQGLPTTAKKFINIATMDTNVVSTTIQTAQNTLAGMSGWALGANADSLTGGTNRRADGTHFTDTGYSNLAALGVTAYSAVY